MARSGLRAHLRKQRQARNKANLLPEQRNLLLSKRAKEVMIFIIFGGKCGKGERKFEEFVRPEEKLTAA